MPSTPESRAGERLPGRIRAPAGGAAFLALLWTVLPGLGPTPTAGQSEPPSFRRISSDHGLSSNSVYAMVEDRRGFLWFGTMDGLNRYDGYEFVVHRHRPGDPESLSSSSVNALLEDGAGALWAGTQRGLNRLVPGTDRFRRYGIGGGPDSLDYAVWDLGEAPDGAIWAATDRGVFRLEAADAGLDVPGTPTPGATSVVVRNDGIAVAHVAEDDGPSHLAWIDPARGIVRKLEIPREMGITWTLHLDARDRLWFGDTAPLTPGDDARPVGGWPASPLTARAYLDAPGDTLWIGTEEGLLAVGPNGGVSRHRPDPDAPTWLHNYARSIVRDRSGALWVGTYAGVYRHDLWESRFEVLTHDPLNQTTLSAGAVSAIHEDPDGTLWIGTFGGGINRLGPDGAVERLRHDPADPRSLPDDVVWAFGRDARGRLWVGTFTGLAVWRSETGDFRRIPVPATGSRGSSSSAQANSLTVDADGRLWVGSLSGLFVVRPDADRPEPHEPFFDGAGDDELDVSWVDYDPRHDAVWLGIEGGILGRLDPATGAVVRHQLETAGGHALVSQSVWQTAPAPGGDVWVASGAGLSRFDPASGSFTHLGVDDGLPASIVYSVASDETGVLWLGTNGGLSRFDPDAAAGRRFRNFGADDGIAGSEFNRNAALRLRDGRLAFGGVDGLTRFHPGEIRTNPYVPPVVVLGVEVTGRDGTRELEPDTLVGLVLTPRDHTFTVRYAALGFSNPVRSRYAYRLEGFDPEWVDAGTRRVARYTSLAPGEYVFRVRGSSGDGVWNDEGASLAVRVRPPFWDTAWFQMLVGLSVVGLAVAAHRYRVGRLLEVERLRLRLARDLHDDLGSDLSGIALATDVVRRRAALPDAESRRLEAVRDTALEKVEALRDIVWYIDPAQDSLDATIRRMRSSAETLLEGLDHRFEVDLDGGERTVGMTFRRNLHLFYKEALHNVVRHASADRVATRLVADDGVLRLTVEDDGVGFDPGRERDGRGLRNLEARAREMAGRMEVESAPHTGTTVRLEVEIPRTRHGAGAGRNAP